MKILQLKLSLIILTQQIVFASSQCPKISCNKQQPDLLCYDYDNLKQEIQISACPSQTICQANNMYNLQAHDLTTPKQYCKDQFYVKDLKIPGEYCAENSDCLSSKCENRICIGFQLGALCQKHEDCDPGLSCSESTQGVCVAQAKLGEPCQTTDNCINSAACYNGTCREYYSLSNGSRFLENDPNKTSYLCESGYIDERLVCADAPKGRFDPDQSCRYNRDCEGVQPSGATVQGSCRCGFGKNQLSYCAAFQGDDEYQLLKQTIKNLIQINQGCHTSLSFSQRCHAIAGKIELQEFLRAYYIYLYRNMLINVESCVVNLINPYARDYKYINTEEDEQELEDEIIIVVIAVIFLVILLSGIIFCIVIRRNQRREPWEDSNQDQGNAFSVASSRLVKIADQQTGSKFTLEDFQLDSENNLALKIGIPVGLQADCSTYEIRNVNPDYPLAESQTPIAQLSIYSDLEEAPQKN